MDHNYKTQSGPAAILRTTAEDIKCKTPDHSYTTQFGSASILKTRKNSRTEISTAFVPVHYNLLVRT